MLHIDKGKGLGRDYTLYTLNNFTFEPGKLRSKSIENKEVTYINMPTIYHYPWTPHIAHPHIAFSHIAVKFLFIQIIPPFA